MNISKWNRGRTVTDTTVSVNEKFGVHSTRDQPKFLNNQTTNWIIFQSQYQVCFSSKITLPTRESRDVLLKK